MIFWQAIEMVFGIAAGAVLAIGAALLLVKVVVVAIDFVEFFRYPYASTWSGVPERIFRRWGQVRLVIPAGEKRVVWPGRKETD